MDVMFKTRVLAARRGSQERRSRRRARKLAPLQRQPTSTLVGKARTNHVRVTVFYRFLVVMLYRLGFLLLASSPRFSVNRLLLWWYGGLLGHFSKKPFSVPLSHRSRLQVM
jgi:hypothetical protein